MPPADDNQAVLLYRVEQMEETMLRLCNKLETRDQAFEQRVGVLESRVSKKDGKIEMLLGALGIVLVPIGGFILWIIEQFLTNKH